MILALYTCILACMAVISAGLGFQCTQLLGSDAFFSLTAMKMNKDYVLNLPYLDNSTMYFNFCNFTQQYCPNASAYAVIVSADNSSCIHLTGSSQTSNYSYALVNNSDASQGVMLDYTNGDQFNATATYGVEFIVQCDPNQGIYFYPSTVDFEGNVYYVQGSSSSGCPVFQMSALWQALANNQILLAIIMMAIGAVECFFGLKLLKPTLFIVGQCTGFGFLVAVFGEFVIKPGTSAFVVWVILIITVLFGTMLGYIALSLPRVGFFCLGFWLGTILAFFLNQIALYRIVTTPAALPLYIAIGVLGVAFGALSCFLWQYLVIISTGVVGAYAMVRPLAWWLGYFPNEFALAQQIQQKEVTSVPWQFYLYLVAILILGAIGVRFQWWMLNRQRNAQKKEEMKLQFEMNKLEEELLNKSDVKLNVAKPKKFEKLKKFDEKRKKLNQKKSTKKKSSSEEEEEDDVQVVHSAKTSESEDSDDDEKQKKSKNSSKSTTKITSKATASKKTKKDK